MPTKEKEKWGTWKDVEIPNTHKITSFRLAADTYKKLIFYAKKVEKRSMNYVLESQLVDYLNTKLKIPS